MSVLSTFLGAAFKVCVILDVFCAAHYQSLNFSFHMGISWFLFVLFCIMRFKFLLCL